MTKLIEVVIFQTNSDDTTTNIFNQCKILIEKGFIFSYEWEDMNTERGTTSVLLKEEYKDIIPLVSEICDFLMKWNYDFFNADFGDVEEIYTDDDISFIEEAKKRNWKIKHVSDYDPASFFFSFTVEIQ